MAASRVRRARASFYAFRVAAFAIIFLLRPVAHADSPAGSEQNTCLKAGALAEKAAGLPAGLLSAIGQVESGRFDLLTGRTAAWPWTIDVAGTGRFFATKAEAVAAVQDLLARGIRSIDVGCFQINLMHHPQAFATLEEAFDPEANATYAARFLSSLRDRTGGWQMAVAFYHSATPAIGGPYRDRVLATWNSGRVPAAIRGGNAGANLVASADPFVIAISPRALQVKVWAPSAAAGLLPASGRSAQPRLPRIITPTSAR